MHVLALNNHILIYAYHTAPQLGSTCWVFDCGESTQYQLQLSSLIRKTSISRVFITHLHGDHVLGLGGLITSLNGQGMEGRTVEIYGPVGTQDLLRVSMQVTKPKLLYNYRVYELAEASDDETVSDADVCSLLTFCGTFGKEIHPANSHGLAISESRVVFRNVVIVTFIDYILHKF
jgi:ribonuclease BN (tRNA processing enzyme)